MFQLLKITRRAIALAVLSTLIFLSCQERNLYAGIFSEIETGPCRNDYYTYCSNVEVGEGRVLRCLQEHSAQLEMQCLRWGNFSNQKQELEQVKDKKTTPRVNSKNRDYQVNWSNTFSNPPSIPGAAATTPALESPVHFNFTY